MYPSEDRQRLVTKVICDVKCKARFLSPEEETSPHNRLAGLVAQSQAPVILGCTDLRVAFGGEEQLPKNITVDSLEVMADVIVDRFLGNGGFEDSGRRV